jgi:hypothetical protein
MPNTSCSVNTEIMPEMFRMDMNGVVISPTGVVAMLNEGNFDVSMLWPQSDAMDVLLTTSRASMDGNERDLGIIATS